MANLPRKHHFVPKLLLAGFTDTGISSGALQIVDLVRRKTYVSCPEDTGKETDYNLIDVEGMSPFAVETDLMAKGIEGPAVAAFSCIRSGGMPDEDQKARLLSFVAMQALRSPNRRDAYDQSTTQLARLMIAMVTEDIKIFEAQQRANPDTLGQMSLEEARELGKHLVAKNSPTGHCGAQLQSFGPILELLAARSWSILTAPEGADFVCCDDPVVLLPIGARSPLAPRGFASLDAAVLMPVGRRHALLGTWPPDGMPCLWSRSTTSNRTVATMNASTVILAARRFVASSTADFPWLWDDQVRDRAAYVELVRNRPG